MTQADKGRAFRQLHERGSAFIIPNPWDIGSARILEHIGFEALATTSMGYAFSLGKLDTTVDRDEMLAHVAALAAATSLPVNADLENGYGDDPHTVAETIRLAAAAGVVGGSIEDATGRAGEPIYDIDLASSACERRLPAARALPFPFTLTARAENFLHGRPISTTLFADSRRSRMRAPMSFTRRVCGARTTSRRRDVSAAAGERPHGIAGRPPQCCGAFGDRRAAYQRRQRALSAAMGAFLRAANEMRHQGTFEFAADAANPRISPGSSGRNRVVPLRLPMRRLVCVSALSVALAC